MRFADSLIAANERRKRDRLGSGESCIPPGSVLHRLDGLAVCILVFIRRSLSHQLLAALRVLALAEFREVLRRHCTRKSELSGETALPLACDDSALRPVVLLLRGELLLVVGLRLASGEWL